MNIIFRKYEILTTICVVSTIYLSFQLLRRITNYYDDSDNDTDSVCESDIDVYDNKSSDYDINYLSSDDDEW